MTAIIVLVLRVGLAAILYMFLWRVFQTLWQDLKQQGSSISSQKKPGIQFDAKMGNGGEATFYFRQNEIMIGRSLQNDISLTDESLSVIHARVSRHHAQWWLEDMDSTNGTYLNKVRLSVPTVIISGDEFRCGNTTFTIHAEQMEISVSSIGNHQLGGSK